MKETIQVWEHTQTILQALPKGILLNTQAEKWNSMVIGWGHLGIIWGKPTFTVYVREHRFTKKQLDNTLEFTLSVPLSGPVPEIARICGSQSGREVDKALAAHVTLEEARSNHTPGIAEYPLTLECKVLYVQPQELARIPEEIVHKMYPQDVDGSNPMANRDAHTAYIGEIIDAYIIR